MKNVLATRRLWSAAERANNRFLILHRRGMSSVKCVKLEYKQHGIPGEVVELKEEQLNVELKTGQVLVKLLACPVNPADINTIQEIRAAYGKKICIVLQNCIYIL
jgi:hypothetical protein